MLLRKYRLNAGFTQKEVAQKLDVLQSSISQWESGEFYPHPLKVQQLAELYEASEGEIISAITAARCQAKTG